MGTGTSSRLVTDDTPAMVTTEHLQRYLSTLVDPRVRRDHGRYAEHFVAYSGATDAAGILEYLDALRKAGYRPGTIRQVYKILRRMFRVNDIPWPLGPHAIPDVPETEEQRPALAPEVIRAMIARAKQPGYPRLWAVYLALATVYGCRRVEMAEATPDDVNPKDGVIFIHTHKHGRQRYHLIPEPILPILARGRTLLRPRSPARLNQIWRKIEASVGFPHWPRVGWHSVRRIVDRELLDAGLPESQVAWFLRWRGVQSSMAHRYRASTVIGWGDWQETVMPTLDRETDVAVFARHPFVRAWAE